MYLECKAKRIFGIACLGKKLIFHTGISTYSLIIRLIYFQKYRISSGQGVVQIEPNLVWSIPCVSRV